MIHANILARLARIFTAVPVLICTAHNTVEGGRIREIIYRLTDSLCDHTTNVSQVAVDRYIKVGVAPKHKISLLRNGIDVSRFEPKPFEPKPFEPKPNETKPNVRTTLRQSLELDHTFTFLAIGRLDDQKDFSTMLKAFAAIKDKQSNLLIVGEGPHQEMLETLVKELELSSRVNSWVYGAMSLILCKLRKLPDVFSDGRLTDGSFRSCC